MELKEIYSNNPSLEAAEEALSKWAADVRSKEEQLHKAQTHYTEAFEKLMEKNPDPVATTDATLSLQEKVFDAERALVRSKQGYAKAQAMHARALQISEFEDKKARVSKIEEILKTQKELIEEVETTATHLSSLFFKLQDLTLELGKFFPKDKEVLAHRLDSLRTDFRVELGVRGLKWLVGDSRGIYTGKPGEFLQRTLENGGYILKRVQNENKELAQKLGISSDEISR